MAVSTSVGRIFNSGSELLAFETPLELDLPYCSVAVERRVKEVTGASIVCVDSRERDGVVKQNIASIDLGRDFLPSSETVCTMMCDFRILNCSLL